MGIMELQMLLWVAASLSLMFNVKLSHGFTDFGDVYAINNLYISLGSPPLPGWISFGGDPCSEGWQGVECVEANITAIKLNGANLGGQLGDELANFASIITMDFSNNQIGGTIPEALPVTMRQFFLSANRFTGSIPDSLSELTLLSDMSLNDNLLTGVLPEAFQSLTELVNLDFSSNNLSGQLPPSMGNLSSLTTLNMQNNRLTGVLDVLQDLPLQNLNIENNLFSGPIPERLFSIPNFKKDGNPFNTTVATSPLLSPAPSPFSQALAPEISIANSPESFTSDSNSSGESKLLSTMKIVGYAAGGLILLIVMFVTIGVCMSKRKNRELKEEETAKGPESKVQAWPNAPLLRADLEGPHKEVDKSANETYRRQREHKIDMSGTKTIPASQPVEKVNVDPISTSKMGQRNRAMNLNHTISVKCFSVATLQQYTNSFGEENLIQDGVLGPMYLAEFPQHTLLAVLKLTIVGSTITDNSFLDLVSNISKIQHPSIVEFLGYCMEFDQQLLVYKYFSKYTLYDILHFEDRLKEKLSWNARMQVAIGAAKALEYLHETLQPPIVLQNFNSNSILLDDDLNVKVSECGFASVLASSSTYQLPPGEHPPEVDHFGAGNEKSDVYSFGVVMLELLTGRKPHDSSLPRVEQHLAIWASSQLHDINALIRMADPSFGGRYPVKSLSRFADIISRCIQQVPEFRPLMSEVVQDLVRVIEDATATEI